MPPIATTEKVIDKKFVIKVDVKPDPSSIGWTDFFHDVIICSRHAPSAFWKLVRRMSRRMNLRKMAKLMISAISLRKMYRSRKSAMTKPAQYRLGVTWGGEKE